MKPAENCSIANNDLVPISVYKFLPFLQLSVICLQKYFPMTEMSKL